MTWVLLIVMGVALYVFIIMALGRERQRGKDFAVIHNDPGAVMAKDKKGDMVRVDLPEGVTSDKVDAVFVGKKPEKAKVKIYHEKTDRKSGDGGGSHEMEI